MKKLLTSAAVCGLVFAAAPAHADIDLEVGGYFKGYGVFMDQDDDADTDGGTAGTQGAGEAKDFDFLRETEIHLGGETTLDNGLTVGYHAEFEADGADEFEVEESYAYFSGGWGRVNFGEEDGAGYLLQVAAPSADSNIDGIRQYVQPVNYSVLVGDIDGDGVNTDDLTALGIVGNSIDYDMDQSGKSTKLTYLSPIMNGFQAGISYTPDTDAGASSLGGVGVDDDEGQTDETYEGAFRYEGTFNNIGMILGAGYVLTDIEETTVPAVDDDREAWNVGADFNIGPFGIGAIYREDNGGNEESATVEEEETIVVGVDYTTGPFKLGASYYTQENTYTVKDLDTDRYSAGVVYTYGPGMTFRGSVGYVEHDAANIGGVGSNDIDATYVTLGTQIKF